MFMQMPLVVSSYASNSHINFRGLESFALAETVSLITDNNCNYYEYTDILKAEYVSTLPHVFF